MKPFFFSLLLLALTVSCKGMILNDNGEEPLNGQSRDTLNLAKMKPALGVNYNEQLQFIDQYDLERSKTVWVRGFLDFFQLYDQPGSLETDDKVKNFVALKGNGYKTVLNIKWNFKGREESLPLSGSQNLASYLQFLDKLLAKTWPYVDLLVIGNEPFIETNLDERDQRLVAFYKSVTERVVSFRKRQPGKFIPVFIGAFNNLYDPAWQTAAADSLLHYASSMPDIAGIDLHIHHAEMPQMLAFMQYASARIRSDQKILITEFSLVKHWKQQLNLVIAPDFARAYGLSSGMKNYQYIDQALKNPRPQAEWFAWLKSSPWFESRKRYLKDAFTLMKGDPKFLLATYAIRQSYPYNQDFTATTDPWVLNGLFANRTIIPEPGGHNALNYAFIDDFRGFQP